MQSPEDRPLFFRTLRRVGRRGVLRGSIGFSALRLIAVVVAVVAVVVGGGRSTRSGFVLPRAFGHPMTFATTEETKIVVETPLAFLRSQLAISAQLIGQVRLVGGGLGGR